MTKEKLALFGGRKTRTMSFPKHPIIDDSEINQVLEVLKSGNLSTFRAEAGKNFLGGVKIREFEEKFAKFIGTKYAVSFNSATSALHAAVVATEVQPGEEVIVPPYTFTSTATCVLMQNAIPIFADVQKDIFCIDPKSIRTRITPLTKAIIPVHLFGHPAEMDEILEIAKTHNLKIIEDCAQAIGAKYKGKNVGTIGDCGIFSFQETKSLSTGEGGMLVTDDDKIMEVARLVRNHGEAIHENQEQRSYKTEILGWGYRMTELEAAIGISQLEKLPDHNKTRNELAQYLTECIDKIEGFNHVKREYVEHAYWFYAFTFDESKIGISREDFVKAINAEGIPFGQGYVKPLYFSPIYHESKPFAYKFYKGKANYEEGSCPITELLHNKELVLTLVLRPPATKNDVTDIITAINKILENKEQI
jgi:perosamine synthetase